jgi:hypothetical protein
MSYTVTPFEVASRLSPEPIKCRFVCLMPGISPRHSDTIDCYFRVNGRRVVVAISSATLAEIRGQEKKSFKDQQLVDIAAEFLKRTLRNGFDDVVMPGRVAEGDLVCQRTFRESEDTTQAEFNLSGAEFRNLARALGYL